MYDVIIKNGTIIDGTGAPSYVGDVAISGDKIAAVGEVSGKAKQTFEADGQLVTPGFIDIHTHLDAQIFWDPILTSSCWHGVTSVVMGNCGVSFAPCKPGDRDYLAQLMESVEDIPAKSINSGISWNWESYGEYLQELDSVPKGINAGGLVGHCALRVFAMGEDAIQDRAPTADEIAVMREAVSEAVSAGALGFSTSRSPNHQTPDGDPVPGTYAQPEELQGICAALGELGKGVVEGVPGFLSKSGFHNADDEATRRQIYQNIDRELAWITDVCLATGRPATFGLTQNLAAPEGYARALDRLAEGNEKGANIKMQSTTHTISVLYGFQHRTPFDRWAPAWGALRGLTLEEKLAKLRDPDYRATMVEQASADNPPVGFDELYLMSHKNPRYDLDPAQTVSAYAERLNMSEPDAFIELSLAENGMAMFNNMILNPEMEAVERMLTDPNVVLGLGDSGAHCGVVMDAGIPTHFLTYWSRERGYFSLETAIHKLTGEPAALYGLQDRGRLTPGTCADINVIDFDALKLRGVEYWHDLPAGAGRLTQGAEGYRHMFVNGQHFMQDGEHTGALAGVVLRS